MTNTPVQMEATTRLRTEGYALEPGDRVTVAHAIAVYWAQNGWARPVAPESGIVVGEPKPGARRIDPDSLTHLLRTPEG